MIKYKKGRKLNESIVFFFSFILFRLTIDIAVFEYFDDLFIGSGDLAIDFNILKYIFSWVVLIPVSMAATKVVQKKNITSIFFILLFFLSYFGTSSLYGIVNLENQYFLIFNVYWILFALFSAIMPQFGKKRINVVGNSHRMFYAIFYLSVAYATYLSFRLTGFRLSISLDFVEIDSMRRASYEFLTGLNAYLIFWIADVIFPLAIAHFLIQKKWLYFIISVVAQLTLFSINGTKTWLLAIPLAVIIVVFYKDSLLRYLGIAMSILNIFGVMIFKYLDVHLVTNLFTRRMFVAQSLNNYFYYDFFRNNEKDMLRGSILRWIGMESPYEQTLPKMISELYYYRLDSNASSGLFADAFSNFGYIGVIMYPLLLVLFFKLFEFLAEGLDKRELIVICTMLSIFLLNGSFFTVFLTFGFLAAIIVVFFYPKTSGL